jgi:peptidoglycan/LPS O-acetylase OafA/YrhL
MKQVSPNLDLLRASAVLLVFVSHLPYSVGSSWDLDFLGHYGVMMFFIHTSLVLAMSLARIERQNENVVTSFYIRRAFRIYPLSMLVVLLAFALRIPPWFHTPFRSGDPLYFWSNLLLFQNLVHQSPAIGPLWSLPYEVQMYLVLPFLYFWGKRLRNPVLLGVGGLSVYLADRFLSREFGYPPLFEYAPWFSLGMALYFTKPRPQFPAPGYGAALAVFIAAPLFWHDTLGEFYVAAVLFVLIFPRFHENRNRWLCGAAHSVAQYSYGIYLPHAPILWFVGERMPSHSAAFRLAVFLLLMVGVPVILYHAVEKPFIELGVRLTTGKNRRVAAAHPQGEVPALRPRPRRLRSISGA